MRLTDLLGAEVVDEAGGELGAVHDVRLRRYDVRLRRYDVGRSREAGLVVEGIIAGVGALQAQLGYAYGDVGGPWLLRWALGRLGRRARYVPWDRVKSFDDGVVTVRGGGDDLLHPSDVGRGSA